MQNQLASILNDRASWAQYEPAVQNALAGLLRKKQEEDELLSQSTIMGNADTAVAMNPQNQLRVLMDNAPPQQSASMPENYLRNDRTGATYGFQSQPQRSAPQIDYTQPKVEIVGYGKGYRSKEGPNAFILDDGRKLTFRDRAGEEAAKFRDIKMRTAEADLEGKIIGNQAARAGSKTAPAGYRYTPEGSLEAIPGGPADIKAGEAGKKAQMREQVLSDSANNVLAAVAEAKELAGYKTTGWGGLTAGIPMTDARKLAGKLNTIKANLGFDRLQQMRDMSPTGGALGQVAVQELEALKATVAALDQLQDPADVQEALGKIEQHYTRWKGTLAGDDTAPSSAPASGWKVERVQ